MCMNVKWVPCNKLIRSIYTLRNEVIVQRANYIIAHQIIVHHTYLLRISFHRTTLQTTMLTSDILYTLLFYYKTVNFTPKLHDF